MPRTLAAAVLVVQPLGPDSTGEPLISRLRQHTKLKCQLGENEQPLEAGSLYLAPPDRHMLVKDGKLLITKGPRENNFRLAADSLFRSAAVAYGANVIGVVLTGMLHDGTAGLEYVKRCGASRWCRTPPRPSSQACPKAPCAPAWSIM
ncbi:hypothetical protein FY528_11050 [Hymenobacter lutimineralis]|uniref:protein-glutamate methylesterase n=1 Tax=Hymenobacter lutimineralis TaxID=2606448 RepID=A0A5D6V252_9BACT|nr:hypothetical protein FY528_11050 [Hymenobacter lutimineralis]